MKKGKILLIRSVSLQQLDKNLPEVFKKFPKHEFYLLTHSHNINNCTKYKGITKLIDYQKKGDFSPFFLSKHLKKEKFDAVVYFVSNIKGYGFLNVSLLAFRLTNKSVFQCNLNSKIKNISSVKTFYKIIKIICITPLAIVLTLPLIPIGLFLLLFLKKK